MSKKPPNPVVQEIARHQSRLRAFVRCLMVRPSDVDDLLQEINVVLWEKCDEFQPGSDFWAWASQIARFKVLNQVRKYGRERLVFDDAVLQQLAAMAEQKLQDLDRRRDALDHCLKQLPPAQRQLIDLRYASGQTVESIAESIGRPAGSIRQTLYRIRAALEACVQTQLTPGGEST
ncbi:MAG: sigma-70 family RNA polymerase sigma factor [Planctomycetales bacterium]|nr:sigma-70 family RNA polymerase sigma factor [Planctomycetales bacterium]